MSLHEEEDVQQEMQPQEENNEGFFFLILALRVWEKYNRSWVCLINFKLDRIIRQILLVLSL